MLSSSARVRAYDLHLIQSWMHNPRPRLFVLSFWVVLSQCSPSGQFYNKLYGVPRGKTRMVLANGFNIKTPLDMWLRSSRQRSMRGTAP